MDKYAIIIVTHNRIELLKECINNALNQTAAAEKIIIVNNASTDGTDEYLKTQLFKNEIFEVVESRENIGGAGGFNLGIEKALAHDTDWLLVIDDDAILEKNYAKSLLNQLQIHAENNREYQAAAGIVKVNGEIDIYHRRYIANPGMRLKTFDEKNYQQETFECDIASFCGMFVKKTLVSKIGLPHKEYFIFHDDTEYSLRILKYSKFLVVTDAVLNHKTKTEQKQKPRRYTWKDYYEIRNRLLYVKEHGNRFDYAVNKLDIMINKVFRNRLFSIIRYDGYDWKFERDTVRRAIGDSRKEK